MKTNKTNTNVNWKYAEAICNARLIELGYSTFLPFTTSEEIDIIAIKDKKVYKIQIKSITPKGNTISLHLARNASNYKKHISKPYTNIDFFLIYDGINIYKIYPDNSTAVTLRYKPTKNNQSKGIKMASDHILTN